MGAVDSGLALSSTFLFFAWTLFNALVMYYCSFSCLFECCIYWTWLFVITFSFPSLSYRRYPQPIFICLTFAVFWEIIVWHALIWSYYSTNLINFISMTNLINFISMAFSFDRIPHCCVICGRHAIDIHGTLSPALHETLKHLQKLVSFPVHLRLRPLRPVIPQRWRYLYK